MRPATKVPTTSTMKAIMWMTSTTAMATVERSSRRNSSTGGDAATNADDANEATERWTSMSANVERDTAGPSAKLAHAAVVPETKV